MDHILATIISLIKGSGIWLSDVTDHFTCLKALKSNDFCRGETVSFEYRERSELNIVSFSNAMHFYPWDSLVQMGDPNECYEHFSAKLTLFLMRIFLFEQ